MLKIPENRFPLDPVPLENPGQQAYEDLDGKREHVTTLTREGRLLEAGDFMPFVPGIEWQRHGLYIVQTVNAFDTETCDNCVDELDGFHRAHPEVPVYSLTKQNLAEVKKQSADQTFLQINPATAIALGTELVPGEGADPDFWSGALRRSIFVVDASGKIVHTQQPNDQEQMPDFDQVYRAALDALAKQQAAAS
ncbi:MAG TPA: hypothetical protein VLF40_03295 [Candidatus Saccharimonadales bacterium]|nr:hypothetical protein [Candidatus Saccharimonadales bacterium]